MTDPLPPPSSLSGLSATQKRELLKRLLEEKARASRQFPMSSQQQGLWHAYRRDSSATAYNVFLPTRTRSALDLPALTTAMQILTQRHHSLRTTFSDSGGQLQQTVCDSLLPDIRSELAEGCSDDELRSRVLAHVQRPFDLEKGPLLRLATFRVAEDDHVIVATTHHIVTDFWSLVLIMKELSEIYPAVLSGRTPTLPPASNLYAQYVQQQRHLCESHQKEALSQYWQQQVKDVAPVLELPLDYRRPKQFSGQAHSIPIEFNIAESEQIRHFARTCGVTTNATLLAAVQVLLSRYSRQSKFLVGIPSSGRSEQQFEDTVGYFSGVLPIRTDLSSDLNFQEFVGQTSRQMMRGMDHERYPFAEIVRDTNPSRDTSRGPLIQTLCTFENSHLQSDTAHAAFLMASASQAKEFGGLLQQPFPVPHPTCHYDIEFAFDTSSEAMGGIVCFCVDLFRTPSMHQLATNFRQLTGALIDQCDRNVTSVAWPIPSSGSTSALVITDERPMTREQAICCERTPSLATLCDCLDEGAGSAVIQAGDPDHSHSPDAILRISGRLAASLMDLGVGREQPIVVMVAPGPAFVLAMLGVLRSGAAFVPIDADQPSLAMSQLFAEVRPRVVITDRPLQPMTDDNNLHGDHITIDIHTFLSQPQAENDAVSPQRVAVDSADLAYVIFTSGSTGRPKGVMIEHCAIANTLRWRRDAVGLNSDDRVISLLSHQFDGGLGVILTTLSQGATLVWPKSSLPSAPDLEDIVDTLVEQRVTVLTANPSFLRAIVLHPRFEQCRWLRQIWTGGESMPTDLPEQISQRSNAVLWNFYGPTETAIEATAFKTPAHHSPKCAIPIGHPIANTEIAILDDQLQPVPEGVPGQITICGRGLARGYWNQPAETASRFRSVDAMGGRRAYLTGDLGRINADGLLEFLGRIDNQIKLRGFRIELEEIEQHLRTHTAMTEVAVCVVGHGDAAQLASLIVATDPVDTEAAVAGLPRYKRPTRFHFIDSIPKSASGKIDRQAIQRLATKRRDHSVSSTGITVARNDLESFLATGWSQTLPSDLVRFDENFFDAGGSSLQAATLTARWSDELGVRVPTSLLFDLADIRGLSARIAELYPTQMEAKFGVDSVRNRTTDPSSGVHPLIAPWQTRGDQTPIFLVHPPGGIVVCYRDLAERLSPRHPLYAIRSKGLHGEEELPATMEAMAADYVQAIHQTRPHGPVIVGGWSLGGLAAVEVTQQLLQSGRDVQKLILLDTTLPARATESAGSKDSPSAGLEYGIDLSLEQLGELPPEKQLPFLWDHANKLGVLDHDVPEQVVQQTLMDLQALFHHHVELANRYRLRSICVPVELYRPTDVPIKVSGPHDRGWSRLADEVTVIEVPGQHHSMLSEPHVSELANHIKR
ncbi:non-ribosomal peptide synthetase [Novipirellula artificiosorum]|uniref:Dimodular nonribosomal peptide synthase n=1 Tax=Novipirellula artificiosorum TaxID=2528016 RepID=A0A5C6DVI6_9BACT|nr:non-ribosomal peptide synthetase [Novipirellula artificiosorum]TWU40628.1 Dimodular nonribosomal peptide synthase [Novipirellula artificiosorum]